MGTLNSILQVVLRLIDLFDKSKREIKKERLKYEIRKRDDADTVAALRRMGL